MTAAQHSSRTLLDGLVAAAAALAERSGIRGVVVCDETGAPLLSAGSPPGRPEADGPRLVRTAEAVGLGDPVLLRDGRLRVLVRGLEGGLRLLVHLEEDLPAGLADRVTRPAAESMRRLLAPLLDDGEERP